MPSIPRKQKRRGYLPEKKAFEGRTNTNMKFYNSGAWRKTRKAFLLQYPLCKFCQDNGRTTAAKVVDHILEINQGGAKLDWENLQPLCHPCHNSKTARNTHEARKRNIKKNNKK